MNIRNHTNIQNQTEESQVVGFRIRRALAREVKAEAGQRGLKLNELFEELWATYKRQQQAKKNG